MTIAMGILGLSVGLLVGTAMGYDKGWKAGVSWAQSKLWGL